MPQERARGAVTKEDPLLALLPEATAHWKRTDPVMWELARSFPPETRPLDEKPAFAALVESVTHQQVSLAAGRTIFGRVVAATGGDLTPQSVLKAGAEGLRAAGLSGQKTSYVLDLAARAADGRLDFSKLPRLPSEDVVKQLTAVKGIGVWTAKMFLIFHLHRPDVVAHEDLGLRLAASRFYNVPPERAAQLIQEKASKWTPYNSVAALVLWNARRAADAT